MTDTNISISVIMAAYNAERTIAKALESALASHLVQDVIVIDDLSQDRTVPIVSHMARTEPRIHLIRNARNIGPGGSRNRGIDVSRGEYLAILDADDFFLPGRLEKIAAYLHDYDFVADGLLFTRELDGPIFYRNMLYSPQRLLTFSDFVSANLTHARDYRCELGFLKPVFSRAFIEKHHLRYHAQLRLGEDYAFYAEALMLGARFYLTEALGYVSLERPQSLSAKHETEDLRALFEFDRHLLTKVSSSQDRTAVLAHLEDTKDRLLLRNFLDAKAARRYIRMWRHFADSFRSAQYISRQMIRAKLGI